ncbi:unnamed protein product [Calicophoron daubneyi]|uniref:Uncharacterized protein n=1 Tax=Calicophoron daubneyi TaxID=300641 RepID=A0AAV2TSF3_CALDB
MHPSSGPGERLLKNRILQHTKMHEGDAFTIFCGGYHALIINTGLPKNWCDEAFLLSLDSIVIIQWDLTTDALVVQLLRRLCSIFHFDVNHTSPDGKEDIPTMRLTCLILPRVMHSSEQQTRSGTTHGNTRGLRCITAAVRLALRLKITILQLSPSSNPPSTSHYLKRGCSFDIRSNSPLHSTRTNHDRCPLSQMVKSHPEKITRERNEGLQLYYKYGVGKLELIPLFETQVIGARHYWFDALFVWHPHRDPHDRLPRFLHGISSTHFLYCASVKKSTPTTPQRKKATASLDRGKQIAKHKDTENKLNSLIHQLTRVTQSLRRSCSKAANSGQLGSLSRQSKTYAANLNLARTSDRENESQISRSTVGSNRISRLVSPPKWQPTGRPMPAGSAPRGDRNKDDRDQFQPSPGFSRLMTQSMPSPGTSLDEVNRPTDTDNEDSADYKYDHDSSQPAGSEPNQALPNTALIPSSCLNLDKPLPSDRQPPAPLPTSDTKIDESTGHYEPAEELTIPPQIHKSTSCPDALTSELSTLDQLSLSEKYGLWSEKNFGSMAFTATVLLAIPEAGESDYYSESPQYLTVAELRELGLYDEDDDDDDDDDDSEEKEEEDDDDDPHSGEHHSDGTDLSVQTSLPAQPHHALTLPILGNIQPCTNYDLSPKEELVH